MQAEITSDTDQSKHSSSPKFPYQHGEELSVCEDGTSPASQRGSKSYHKMRPASAPRAYVTETNIWGEFSLPSYCMPDYRRAPAMYIEQDIINKQRQEIQLLMEELGNRDQELTDLVNSHQKQVMAWESDNEKYRTLQARLAQYEDELKSKEEQLKKVLAEVANVNYQRGVDVKELKRTQSEMIKLTERILENSLYIKEMEAQNQKLNNALTEFASIRQAFRVREQELLSLLKEKDFQIADKLQEVNKLNEYVKILESQCRELGEQNNNMTEESISWRKKYNLLKEETERLNDDNRRKEENIRKMTQQLHESLQQAIALQKALFTSCEREKCKEEVMYSLRRQHKRTMQELQNIRELYDRLTRDTTLYHLSIKEKEMASEGKRKEDDSIEEERRKKKYMEDTPSWHHDSRRKVNMNMSFNKLKQLEGNEESFLLKESKERKAQAREGKNYEMSEEDSADNNTEEETRNGNRSTNYSRPTERSRVRGDKVSSQRVSPNVTTSRLKSGLDSSQACFTNQASGLETGSGKFPAVGLRNQTKNPEPRSPCHSPLSVSSGISQKANPASLQEVVGDVSPETADMNSFREKSGVNEQCPSASHAASGAQNDGMCHEVSSEKSQKDTSLNEPAAQPQESTTFQSKESRIGSVGRKDDLLNRDQGEHQVNTTSSEPASGLKQLSKKKCVDFDMQDKTIPSCIRQMGAQSHSLYSEGDCHSPQSHDRRDACAAKSHLVCLSKCQLSIQSADGSSGSFPVKTCEDSLESSSQRSGKSQHFKHELSQENDCRPRESEKSTHDGVETDSNMKPLNVDEHRLRLEVCDQCRARGRRVCDCSKTSRSSIAYSKLPSATFASNLLSCDKSYPCQKEPVSLTSKFSFVKSDLHLDYCSSMMENENSHVQDLSTGDFSENPLTYPLMTVFKNPPSHQPIKKIQFSLPTVDTVYNQNQHHKVACEDLPDEIIAYLARQRSFKRENYYNNNNKSDNQHAASDMVGSRPIQQQCSSGQSLSASSQSLSSSGQPSYQLGVISGSQGKPTGTVISSKIKLQESEFQKDRLQKIDCFRNERREKVLETDRIVVSHTICDGNTKKNQDCGKRSCNMMHRSDTSMKIIDGDYKRSDVFDAQCDPSGNRSNDTQRRSDSTQRRSDDSQKRSHAGQRSFGDSQKVSCDNLRRSDDNQRSGGSHKIFETCQRTDDDKARFDYEVGCDNSANNSNRENATCSAELCCGMRDFIAREKTSSESKQRLSFLQVKKTCHAQDKNMADEGEFQYDQTTPKTQNEARELVEESYFCPEESENEVYADKTSSTKSAGHGISNGRCSESASKNANFSGHSRLDNRPCEMEDRSNNTNFTEHEGSDTKSHELQGTCEITISSGHRGSGKMTCQVKGRSDNTTLAGHEGSNSNTHEVEKRSNSTMSSGQEGSDSISHELKGRSDITLSSGHERSRSLSYQTEVRSIGITSSKHRTLDRKSWKLEDSSSTQKRLEKGSSERISRPGFTLYSKQERLENQLFQPKCKNGVTLTTQGGTGSRSAITGSSVHKQSNSGYSELVYKARQQGDDNTHDTPIHTSHVTTSCSDSPCLDNSNQHHLSSDHSSGRVSVPGVMQRSYNCAHAAERNISRNCFCSSESAKSQAALKSGESCMLSKDISER